MQIQNGKKKKKAKQNKTITAVLPPLLCGEESAKNTLRENTRKLLNTGAPKDKEITANIILFVCACVCLFVFLLL